MLKLWNLRRKSDTSLWGLPMLSVGGRGNMRLNYFTNFMLKHHPHELTERMLREQDNCFAILKRGEKIELWPGCNIAMQVGKIITEDEGRYE